MRSFILFVVGALLAPFAAGLAVELAKPLLPAGSSLLPWASSVLEAAALPWVVAGAGGVFLGMFLDRISARFDGRRPMGARGKLKKLADEAEWVALRCENAISGATSPLEHNALHTSILMLNSQLNKLGLSEPSLPHGVTARVMFYNFAAMLRALGPAMVAGDLETARAVSKMVREGQIRNPTKEPASDCYGGF